MFAPEAHGLAPGLGLASLGLRLTTEGLDVGFGIDLETYALLYDM